MTNIEEMTNIDEMPIKNEKGMTLIELLISIVIGTIIITMLMQQLVMVVQIRRNFEYENRMLNESYYIAEQIKFNIFNLQAHSIEVIEDSSTQTVIHIVHEYDITSGAGNIIERDYTSPVTDILVWDKVNEKLTYNGLDFHSQNIKIVAGSAISIIRIDPDFCIGDPSAEICGQGILKIELNMSIELDGGGRLDPQIYITTIIV